jgi:hypothetical protein
MLKGALWRQWLYAHWTSYLAFDVFRKLGFGRRVSREIPSVIGDVSSPRLVRDLIAVHFINAAMLGGGCSIAFAFGNCGWVYGQGILLQYVTFHYADTCPFLN